VDLLVEVVDMHCVAGGEVLMLAAFSQDRLNDYRFVEFEASSDVLFDCVLDVHVLGELAVDEVCDLGNAFCNVGLGNCIFDVWLEVGWEWGVVECLLGWLHLGVFWLWMMLLWLVG
jgi:hypothetical protein